MKKKLIIYVVISLFIINFYYLNQIIKNRYKKGSKPNLPYYFERYQKTKKLEDLFEDYSIFHSTKNTKNTTYVIFKVHHLSGIGNILLGLVSTYLYALISERKIYLDWEKNKYCIPK
jgi:hypothetical protein